MAILFAEGFEHQTANSLLTGWGAGPQLINNSFIGGGGAFGVRSGEFLLGAGQFQWAVFRPNISAGRATRVRHVHYNYNFAVFDTFRSNIIGPTIAGTGMQCGFRTEGSEFRFVRTDSFSIVAQVSWAPFSVQTVYPFKASIFIDNTVGTAKLWRGEATTPVLDASGADTQNAVGNYADYFSVLGEGFQSRIYLDDLVVYSPSILLDVGGGSIASGEVLTLNGTATVTVYDVDTTPDYPSQITPAGSVVRVWVHGWNDVEFSDGDTATGGTLTSATVIAPSASYQGGFEPWSWPQYQPVVGVYLTRQQPTANGAVNLTPVGSATNVENVNNVPLNTSAYNEATTGVNLADTYTTYAALPSGVQAIRGVVTRASGQGFGTYTSLEATLTDGSGVQVLELDLSATADCQVRQFCEVDSAGAAWGTTLPVSGTFNFKV